jgi:hypothetical protein
MVSECIRIPSDDELSSRSAWRKTGSDTYSALRAHMLVVKRKERQSPKGPAALIIDLPSGCEFQRERTIGSLTKYTEEILHSIQDTVNSKLSQELLDKVGAEIGVNPTGFPVAKLIAEVQAKTDIELTHSVQNTLSLKKSFEKQVTNEFKYTLKYVPPKDGEKKQTTITLYPRLSQWRWDFYLHKVELVTLRYRRNWRWKQVRDSIDPREDTTLRPLFSVIIYEPQELSMTDEEYVPEIDDADQVTMEPLHASTRERCEDGASFRSLIKLAFPETKDEWAIVAKRSGRKAAAKKASRKKMAEKKAPARRIAAKKAPARRMPAKKAFRR